jgi:hypothetical protein
VSSWDERRGTKYKICLVSLDEGAGLQVAVVYEMHLDSEGIIRLDELVKEGSMPREKHVQREGFQLGRYSWNPP